VGDDFSKKGGQDRGRVNLTEHWERRYWATTFGVSEEELEEAVKAVGSQVENLWIHFRNQSRQR